MRCSLAFGVMLRLLVINISSSTPAINTATYNQRCVITCDTLAVVHRRPRLQHLPVAALTQASVKSDIGSESRFLLTPPAFDAPFGGRFPSEYCYAVWHGKLKWRGYPMVKKIDSMFIRFDRIHERDTHTHTHTHTPIRTNDTLWGKCIVGKIRAS